MSIPTVSDLSNLLGRPVPAAQGAQALNITTQAVKAYIRGGANWVPNAEQASVILTSAARLVSNPSQLDRSESVGPQSASWRGGFTGFSIGEQLTLNRWRVQAR